MTWKYMAWTENDVNVKQIDLKVMRVKDRLEYKNLTHQHNTLICLVISAILLAIIILWQ